MKILIVPLSCLMMLASIPAANACNCNLPRKKAKLEPLQGINMVQTPAYTAIVKKKKAVNQETSPVDKLQYEPINAELPLLIEKSLESEQTPGSEYERGIETVAAPQATEVIKSEPIVEPSPQSPQ